MNAQLKPIAPAIQRPRYDNHFVGYEADWIKANYSALSDWYSLLSAEVGESLSCDDFPLFCRCQHDIEVGLRTAYRETHSKWRDQ
jgi:hypothetical protein